MKVYFNTPRADLTKYRTLVISVNVNRSVNMVDVLIAEENLRFTISHFDFPCGDMDDQFLVDLAISRANEIMFKNYGRETIQFVKMVINQQVKHAKTYNHFYAIL